MDANSLPTATSALSIDVTTLYYTYSTIAQTLAGAFGIIGAFALFRLQGLNQSIRAFATKAYDSLGPMVQIHQWKDFFYGELWDKFLDALEEKSLSGVWNQVALKDDLEKYRGLLKVHFIIKNDVILRLKQTAKWTSFTIILSLALLPLSPLLAHDIVASIILLILTLGFTVYCIRQYVKLILSTLSPPEQKVIKKKGKSTK